jgi:hypothetical protein
MGIPSDPDASRLHDGVAARPLEEDRLPDRGLDVEQPAVVEIRLAAKVDAPEEIHGHGGVELGAPARLDRYLLEAGEVDEDVLVSAGHPEAIAGDGPQDGLNHAGQMLAGMLPTELASHGA